MRPWAVAGVGAGVLALALPSCGDSERAPQSPAPPARLAEPDAGDERGIAVRVRITVTADAITVRPGRVAAFLPLRFTARNAGDRRAVVRAPGVPLATVEPGDVATRRSAGLRPGPYTVRAGGRRARLRVVSGG